ncbi:MAG: Bax inhibitor-1/YccA family protein [Candidatus Marinimicrobia bacterium]|nr:Bax inhibitor-1/YccA family protein [Candidatus Neomarinimicrobiota bacterium]
MNRHLTFRSGNPSLNAKTFSGFDLTTGATMTIMGTVQKTALSLLLLMTTALFTWNLPLSDPRANGLMMLGVFGGLGVAILTVFKHHLAKYTVPAYALLQGLALGGISKFFESMYPGIVNQAVMLTFGTLGALLLAYSSGLIKATENFKLGVVAATGGIAFVYLISWVLGMFGVGVPIIHGNSNMSILFSIGVVIIAALNLVLDFDFIEEGAEKGAPKYMEWYGAFGLLVTLIWLYLEILRLLAKLSSRRN